MDLLAFVRVVPKMEHGVLNHDLETYVYYSRYPLDHWAIKATASSNFSVWMYRP
jgi:hypothetical protein